MWHATPQNCLQVVQIAFPSKVKEEAFHWSDNFFIKLRFWQKCKKYIHFNPKSAFRSITPLVGQDLSPKYDPQAYYTLKALKTGRRDTTLNIKICLIKLLFSLLSSAQKSFLVMNKSLIMLRFYP